MADVHLVATGGTIDKRYDPLTGHLYVGDPVLPVVLAQAGIAVSPDRLHAILRKDSLDINDAERAHLARYIAGLTGSRVLVTHGTDTMGASAACIEGLAPGKTVVLTGAMVPYSIEASDAAFNIGVAYLAAQILPAGVYIAMHGLVLPHATYVKDRAQGRFLPKIS